MGWLFRHIRSWPEVYVGFPLALIAISLFSHLALWYTGYKPRENFDFMPGLAVRILECVLIIILLAFRRQTSGVWLTKEETIASPSIAWAQRVTMMFFAVIFYLILHH